MATNEDKANDKKKKRTSPLAQRKQASRGAESLQTGNSSKVFAGTKDYSDPAPRQPSTLGSRLAKTGELAKQKLTRTGETIASGRDVVREALGVRPGGLVNKPIPSAQVSPTQRPGIARPQVQDMTSAVGQIEPKFNAPIFRSDPRPQEATIPTEYAGQDLAGYKQVPTPTPAQMDELYPATAKLRTMSIAPEAERTNVPVNVGTPFEQRMREGDVFSYGTVGGRHKQLANERFRLAKMQKNMTSKKYAAALSDITARETGYRLASTEAAKDTTEREKAIATAQKATEADTLGQRKLEVEIEKMDRETMKFNVEIANKYGIGNKEFLGIYEKFMSTPEYDSQDPASGWEAFLQRSGLGAISTDPRQSQANRTAEKQALLGQLNK